MSKLSTGFVQKIMCVAAAVLLASGSMAVATVSCVPESVSLVDTAVQISEAEVYADAAQKAADGYPLSAYYAYNSISGYLDSEEKAKEQLYIYAGQAYEKGMYPNALYRYEKLGDYKDSAERYLEAKYAYALLLMEWGDTEMAKQYFRDLGDYKEAEYHAMMEYIEEYRNGNYSVRYDITEDDLLDKNGLAELYWYMCTFREAMEESFPNEPMLLSNPRITPEQMSGYMEWFAGDKDNEDVAELLEDPLFYTVRFFGSRWENGEYYIDAVYDDMYGEMKLEGFLPWGTPGGEHKVCFDFAGRAMIFSAGIRGEWFRVTGFDSNDSDTPDTVFITDKDGNSHRFTRAELPALTEEAE